MTVRLLSWIPATLPCPPRRTCLPVCRFFLTGFTDLVSSVTFDGATGAATAGLAGDAGVPGRTGLRQDGRSEDRCGDQRDCEFLQHNGVLLLFRLLQSLDFWVPPTGSLPILGRILPDTR